VTINPCLFFRRHASYHNWQCKKSPNLFINHQKVASVLLKTEHQRMIEDERCFLVLSQLWLEWEQNVTPGNVHRGLQTGAVGYCQHSFSYTIKTWYHIVFVFAALCSYFGVLTLILLTWRIW
jgi:hypothetical protein